MSTRELAGGDAARLGSAQARLEPEAALPAIVGGQLLWGIDRRVVRAWLWAHYNGWDPLAAVAKRSFGAEGLDALTPAARALVRARAQRLAELQARLGVAIPRRPAGKVAA